MVFHQTRTLTKVFISSYCCQNKSHEFGSSHLLPHNSVTQKSGYSVAWLGPLFGVSQGWNQAISRTSSLREGSGEEYASKLSQIVGKFISLGFQGATLCSLRPLLSPCTWLLHLKANKDTLNPSPNWNLPDFPLLSVPSRERCLLFKGPYD